MSQSPFRDDRVALMSAIEELQRENDSLGREVVGLRAEVQQLRDASPENTRAFVQRLQEDNDELRARVAELEPLREQAAAWRRRGG